MHDIKALNNEQLKRIALSIDESFDDEMINAVLLELVKRITGESCQ